MIQLFLNSGLDLLRYGLQNGTVRLFLAAELMFVLLGAVCGVLARSGKRTFICLSVSGVLRAVSLHQFRSGKDGAHGRAYLAPGPGGRSGGILHRLLRGPGVLQEPARTDRQRETLKGLRSKSAAPETRK